VAALVAFTNWLPNASDGGDKVTGAVPVPLNCVVWGEFEELSLTVNIPVRDPVAVGVKLTEIAQLAPAPNVLGDNGQVEVSPKLPVFEILVMVRGTVWLFLSVTLFAVPVVLITWGPKERLALDKVTGVAPVPLNYAVCGELEALSLTVSVPVSVPRALGVKVTEIAQFAPAPNVLGDSGQFDVCAKLPVVEIPAMVRAAV
jgi:hypothetical protein